MAQAIRVLVVGGVLNLALSFLLGWVLSLKRMKEPMSKHHWLLTAHTVSLQQGLMLIAIAYALSLTRVSQAIAIWAAWLLVAASVFQDFSGIVNWWRGTEDQFKERSGGWVLASINAVLNTAGLGLVVYAVFV